MGALRVRLKDMPRLDEPNAELMCESKSVATVFTNIMKVEARMKKKISVRTNWYITNAAGEYPLNTYHVFDVELKDGSFAELLRGIYAEYKAIENGERNGVYPVIHGADDLFLEYMDVYPIADTTSLIEIYLGS